jgi:hypothetical protein
MLANLSSESMLLSSKMKGFASRDISGCGLTSVQLSSPAEHPEERMTGHALTHVVPADDKNKRLIKY